MQELQYVEPIEHHATLDAYAFARVERSNVLVCIVADVSLVERRIPHTIGGNKHFVAHGPTRAGVDWRRDASFNHCYLWM